MMEGFSVISNFAVTTCIEKERKRKKKCSFENALVEKSESSTRNKNGLVEGLLLFSIQMFTFTDWSDIAYYFNLIFNFILEFWLTNALQQSWA